MTSTNQTSLILLSLDKALVDNANSLKPAEGKALLLAAFKTIVGAPIPIEEAVNNNHNGEQVNANAIPNRR